MLFLHFKTTDFTSQRTSSLLQSISLKENKTTGPKIRTSTKPLGEKTQAALWQRQKQSNTKLGPVPSLQESDNQLDTFTSLKRNVIALCPVPNPRNSDTASPRWGSAQSEENAVSEDPGFGLPAAAEGSWCKAPRRVIKASKHRMKPISSSMSFSVPKSCHTFFLH